MVQYSSALKFCLSRSRSTISFKATLCTRPALDPLVFDCINLLNLNPIILSKILLVSCELTKSLSISRGCFKASIIAFLVTSLKTIRFEFSSFKHSLCIVDVHASHADLTDDYAAVPYEMKKVAQFFGKEFLREVDEKDFYNQLVAVRKEVGDRAILRAIHLFNENKRVEKAVSSLKNNDFDTFKQIIKDSGDSSYKYLQNVYSNKYPDNQAVSLALALSEGILENHGVCRVHGGGFAGTIQAFVEDEYVDHYKEEIEKYFGEGSCHVLKVRKFGGMKVL